MVRFEMTLRLLSAAALLTGVALAGTAMAASTDGGTPATASATIGTTATVAGDAGPTCARKIKVVYAGYGEAERAGCAQQPSSKSASK